MAQKGKLSMGFLMLIIYYTIGLIDYVLHKNKNPNFQKGNPTMASVLIE